MLLQSDSAGTEVLLPKVLQSGVVIESRLDKGRGPVASVLVQSWSL